jgi:hypothetical protein
MLLTTALGIPSLVVLVIVALALLLLVDELELELLGMVRVEVRPPDDGVD